MPAAFRCGHPKSEENTYTAKKTGWTTCRTCQRRQSKMRMEQLGWVNLCVPMPEEHKARLAEMAKAHRCSMSKLVRDLIQALFDQIDQRVA